MEPLKYVYNKKFIADFSKAIKQVVPNFKETVFMTSVFDVTWDNLELKQRMRHIYVIVKKTIIKGL